MSALRARVAAKLGLPASSVEGFSSHTLREMVKDVSPKLAHELTQEIRSGSYIVGEPLRRSKKRKAKKVLVPDWLIEDAKKYGKV